MAPVSNSVMPSFQCVDKKFQVNVELGFAGIMVTVGSGLSVVLVYCEIIHCEDMKILPKGYRDEMLSARILKIGFGLDGFGSEGGVDFPHTRRLVV